MWYRVAIQNGEKLEKKIIDDRVLAEWKADGKNFDIETKNKWLEGVVGEFSAVESDGWILDQVINLIDNGECYA